MEKKHGFGFSSMTFWIVLLAVLKFTLHLVTAQHYGYFCDELYTIAMSKHLALGYVDLPPLVPALLAFWRMLFGESLLSIHSLPAIAGSLTLVFVCLITKELGGRPLAVGLTGLCFLVTPIWLTFHSFCAYDGFDQLMLSLFLFTLTRLIRTENVKLWVPLGLAAGLACLTKMTLPFMGPGFIAALLIFKIRKHLITPWPWIGAGLFLLVLSPYVLWQHLNGWPTLEYWNHYADIRLFQASLLEYSVNIALLMNPLFIPLLIIGLIRLFRPFGSKSFRFLGVMFIITLAVLFFRSAKAYMLVAMFMPVISAGAIWFEEKIEGSKRLEWLKTAVITWLLVGGVLLAPFSMPLLQPKQLEAYSRTFGFLNQLLKLDRMAPGQFPQTLSDRFGWESVTEAVAQVYASLSPEDKKDCGILADWYGTAGAIDLLGQRYGLPPAVCGHLTYYLWGPGETSWKTMIVVGGNYGIYQYLFEEATWMATSHNEYAMPYNRSMPVYLCRNPKMSVEEIWKRLKSFN